MREKPAMQITFIIVSMFLMAGLAAAQIGFDPAANYFAGDLPDTAALGDFNQDGNLDMAVTSDNPDKVSVFFNQGDGTFGAPNTVLLAGGSGAQYIIAGDLDGNGSMDLAVTLKNFNTVQVILNNGSGTFTPGASWAVGQEPRRMAVGDLDNDNDLDLVTSNRDSNNVSVLLNMGPASFNAAVNYSVGQDPRSLTLGDFNGDNDLDIAVSAHDDRAINILNNAGNGSFTAGANLSVGGQLRPEGVVAHDLDNNGSMDIAAGTSGNGLNFASVFLNNGSGTFTGPTNFAVGGVDPSEIVAADFNLDGNPDLATVNTTSNNVSALPGNGSGGFGASTEFSVGASPENLIAGDLDGNGSKDLVTVNKDTDDVSVLINQDTGWIDLGFGLAGTHGVPSLTGTGAMENGSMVDISMTGALENSTALFVVGLSRIDFPFLGGTFVPSLEILVFVPTSSTGSLSFSSPWPEGIPGGMSFFFQVWIDDPGATQGSSATNALEGITQ